MRLFTSAILVAAIFLPQAKAAEPVIKEITSMRQMLPALEPESVVIFDLDNTTMEAVQTLGTDQFFTFLVHKGLADGLNEQGAKDRALEQSGVVQPISRVRAVEDTTPAFIDDLQVAGHSVFALTARPFAWALGTTAQVASLGIDFSLTAPAPQIDLREGQIRRGFSFWPMVSTKEPRSLNYSRIQICTPRTWCSLMTNCQTCRA